MIIVYWAANNLVLIVLTIKAPRLHPYRALIGFPEFLWFRTSVPRKTRSLRDSVYELWVHWSGAQGIEDYGLCLTSS